MKTKQLTEYLSLAGVPDGLHAQVLACMHEAKQRSAAKWAYALDTAIRRTPKSKQD